MIFVGRLFCALIASKFSFLQTLNTPFFLFQDDVCLGSLENLAVDLTIPLKGGKVHGSLARAGKVRGQTPKVRTNSSVNPMYLYEFLVVLQ
jgi:hypothetical protein